MQTKPRKYSKYKICIPGVIYTSDGIKITGYGFVYAKKPKLDKNKKYYVKFPSNWNTWHKDKCYFYKNKHGLVDWSYFPAKLHKRNEFTLEEIERYHLGCFHRDEVKGEN